MGAGQRQVGWGQCRDRLGGLVWGQLGQGQVGWAGVGAGQGQVEWAGAHGMCRALVHASY